MKREIIWVEPLSMYLEKWKAPHKKFGVVNAIYERYFPKDPPVRIFVNVTA
jgi:hypothetical protein